MSAPLYHRARVANLSQRLDQDHPRLVEARRALAAANLEAHIRRVVDGAPPLSVEQRDRLASMLRAGSA